MVRQKLLAQAAMAALIGLVAVPFAAKQAQATPSGALALPGGSFTEFDILCAQGEAGCAAANYTRTANDGTMFNASPNPSNPSTGTGVFQPFYRLQTPTGQCGSDGCLNVKGNSVSTESGFNTDHTTTTTMNFDTKPGLWTHAVKMSDLQIIPGGYIVLSLDANEAGSATSLQDQIALTQLEIFIGPGLGDPEASNTGINGTGYAGTQFDADNNQTDDKLLSKGARWSLDSATNGDVDVVLQASICDTPGQCGSGHGDLDVFVPVSLLGNFSPTDNFVLYSEFLYPSGGFEEWKFSSASGTNGGGNGQVPEPGTLALFGVGLAGLWSMRRKARA
jgi:hypothetical protein